MMNMKTQTWDSNEFVAGLAWGERGKTLVCSRWLYSVSEDDFGVLLLLFTCL